MILLNKVVEASTIDNWNHAAVQIKSNPGQVHADVPAGQSVDINMRSCDVRFITFKQHKKIYNDIFNNIFPYVDYYQLNFNVDIFRRLEIQHTTYNVGGHYNLHTDIDIPLNGTQRKLSLILMLSNKDEYEGGNLVLENKHVKLNMGDMIIFHSKHVHGVKPVTAGIRKTLVMWVSGPAWR